jgi:hypothetical protein
VIQTEYFPKGIGKKLILRYRYPNRFFFLVVLLLATRNLVAVEKRRKIQPSKYKLPLQSCAR